MKPILNVLVVHGSSKRHNPRAHEVGLLFEGVEYVHVTLLHEPPEQVPPYTILLLDGEVDNLYLPQGCFGPVSEREPWVRDQVLRIYEIGPKVLESPKEMQECARLIRLGAFSIINSMISAATSVPHSTGFQPGAHLTSQR